MRNIYLKTVLFILILATTACLNALSIDLPDSITFTAGESITEYFADYIVNNTGNPITLTCSGNVNVNVNIHHGTDVDFSSDVTWSGTEVLTFTVTDGNETATDDIEVIVTPAAANLIIELPDSITFTAGESITEYFADYIVNNTGNPITLTCSGNVNVNVNIHHGTDVDFSSDVTWGG
ncbi:MAG: hypothetical protein K9M99_10625, partial [Candidatus Cloacimonetes bacterium]|nr:hypothetical protein [Candidatus Cloacimonadota bacterium]